MIRYLPLPVYLAAPLPDVLRRYPVIAVWTLGIVLYSLDFAIKAVPLWASPLNVEIGWDHIVPFSAGWAWVYIYAWLLFLLGGGAMVAQENRQEWPRVRALLIALTVMQVGAWMVHAAIPTTMPRPDLAAELLDPGLLIHRIYATDPPTHVLPSLHMASVFVMAWFFAGGRGALRIAVGTGAVVIIMLSVMYTKQHGFVDVITGIGWGYLACRTGCVLSRAVDGDRAC